MKMRIALCAFVFGVAFSTAAYATPCEDRCDAQYDNCIAAGRSASYCGNILSMCLTQCGCAPYACLTPNTNPPVDTEAQRSTFVPDPRPRSTYDVFFK